MTNKKLLAEAIVNQITKEVEKYVETIFLETESLDAAEQASREFSKSCGLITLQKHVDACLEAQNHGHAGDRIEMANGETAHFERYETRYVLTHLGRIRVRRAYYWSSKSGTGEIPLDKLWDLDEREPSPSLRRSIGMLSAEIPFVRGRKLMMQTALVELPEKRIQESGEALGAEINRLNREEADAALPMLRDANVGYPDILPSARKGTLYILMDGGRINTTTEGWREPKVATMYWGEDILDVSKKRREVFEKEYIATLGDADELAERLWAVACRWEWWKAERVVILGDGAPWIWNRARDLFPDATQILDLYHAKEHIWATGRLLYGGAGKQKDKGAGNVRKESAKDRKTADWAVERIAELKEGNIDAIIANLESRRPKTQAAMDSVEELIGYLKENRVRTNYAQYKAHNLCVGSGSIESGVKNVVNQRMKGCGMRWAVNRAEFMLNLRAAHLSDVGPAKERLAA